MSHLHNTLFDLKCQECLAALERKAKAWVQDETTSAGAALMAGQVLSLLDALKSARAAALEEAIAAARDSETLVGDAEVIDRVVTSIRSLIKEGR